MDSTGVLKSVLKSSSTGGTDLASKVRNIEGNLRMPMRSVTFTKPLNDKVAAVNEASLGDIPHITKEKDPIQAKEKLSFASIVNEQPFKKAVKIKELRNELSVNGATVTIPIKVVEAVNARSTYARALIEILADVDLLDSLVIVIPRCDKEGHTFATIDIEYE
ncbi:hypothetical protein Tco_0087539 [Tanacetum coccineum]